MLDGLSGVVLKDSLVSVLLPLFIVLLVLELSSRVAMTIRSDFQSTPDQWFVFSSTLGWTRAPDFHGLMECGVRRNFDANGFRSVDSHQIDDDDRQKVVFLGDSTTMGFCVEAEDSFVELIDEMLPNASAINLGINGYTSYQGKQTLIDLGASLKPDLIVVSFNFNDRRYVLDPSQADSPGAFSATFRTDRRQRWVRLFEKSHLVRALGFMLKAVGLVRDTNVPTTGELQTLRPRVTLEQYKENLASIVRWARENESEVLFVLLGDNPARTAHLDSGIEHLRAGEFDEALEDLWVTRRDQWFGDLARLHQAEAYRSTERPEEADAVSMARTYWSLHGGRPMVLDTVYNSAMREVGRGYRVKVVDARAVLNQSPGVFIDNAHFDERGHRIAADLLVEPIKNLLATSERRDVAR